MVNTALYFISLSLLIVSKSADLSCSGTGGCGEFATCDYEFVANKVYGCGGSEWTGHGVTHGSYLCRDGYSICSNGDRASELGLTLSLCLDTSITSDYYYVSLAGADQSNTESSTCIDGGINNLFGCANPNTAFIQTSSVNCGPLGAMLTTQTSNNGQGWKAGWEPWADPWTQLDEVTATRHLKTQICDPPEGDQNCERQEEVKGGVLCCKDAANATDTPSSAPTTPSPTSSPIPFTDAQLDRISEWKSRAVYQVITDRFARDYDDDYNCTDLYEYCGGTFLGIKNKLDYIQGLGYDAIWISPVIENTKNGYHGYWAKNIYEINPYFGTEEDLIELVEALHDRDMYLMIDIVINHMGQRNATTFEPYNYTYDYSGFTPFDSDEYYHNSCADELCDQYCSIGTFDYTTDEGLERIEKCRLAGLPDLNQSNPDVMDLLCEWVSEYIEDKWMADAIRLDTVPQVSMEYWYYFLSQCTSDSTFNVGEYFYGDPAVLGLWQPTMDSLFGYPMYYTLIDVFGKKEGMGLIPGRLWEYTNNFLDYSALGLFIDNHDNPRWLCNYPDITNYKNALLFIHTFPGIPYGYYGAEQGFDGCHDPDNREPLWPSEYDTESDLYVYIATINEARKGLEIYDGEFQEVWSESDMYAFSRGDNTLILLTNTGESFNRNITVNTLKTGQYCNVLDIDEDDQFQDCFQRNGDGDLVIDFKEGAGKFYVAVDDIPIVTTKFYYPISSTISSTDEESSEDPIVSTKYYDPTGTISTSDDESSEDPSADGIDRIHGIYAVFMAILMTFWNFYN